MAAIVLDGKTLARQIEVELSVRVRAIKEMSNGVSPILATILVGDDPSSATYVKMKGNACQRVGMESLKVVLPQSKPRANSWLNSINSTLIREFKASCSSTPFPRRSTNVSVLIESPSKKTLTA